MSIQTTYDYLTPADYVYNPLLIGVAAGASLIFQNNPGQDFTQDFLSDVGFIYNASNTEFVAGVMRQIQKAYRPTYYLGTFFANYDTDINGNYGDGVLTGTAFGGASVSGGKLVLDQSDVRYVDYAGVGNIDGMIQTGCIRFKVTPNYTGSPAGDRTMITVSQAAGNANNFIFIRHSSDGQFRIYVYDNIAAPIFIGVLGAWSPTAATEYEIELNFDVTAGASRLFIDGTQFGATQAATGTRNNSIGLLRVGSNVVGADSSDFSIQDVILFNDVQHTANYVPAPYGLLDPQYPTFYAGFEEDANGDWGNGVLTGTLNGGAVVSSGQLDLRGGTLKYAEYAPLNNFTATQQGCARVRWTPDYNGSPASVQDLVDVSNGVDDNNRISLGHSVIGEPFFALYDAAGVSIYALIYFGAWAAVSGTEYEFEINWDISTGETRLFIDGIQFGATKVDTGVHGLAGLTALRSGTNHITTTLPDFQISDILLFDSVQHTSNYTPDWSDVRPYEYDGDVITLPEMEYTGVGTLVSFDNFPTTETNAPRYTLQIGRSGNYLWWTGAAWAISNNTYAESTPQVTFSANLATLPILGEIYGQFRIYYQGNIGAQQSNDEITASLTAQIYPSNDPTITSTAAITTDELENLTATFGGSGNVGFVCQVNSVNKYHDGSSWVVSDLSYAQSNTVSEIVANRLTLMADEYNALRIIIVLNSDGSQDAYITLLDVYTNYAPAPVTVVKRTCYINTKDFIGDDATACPMKIKLNKKAVDYNGTTLIINEKIDTVESKGYYDIELVETDSMEAETFYIISINGRVFRKLVPAGVVINILDLPDYTS